MKAADKDRAGFAIRNALNPIDESGEVEYNMLSRGFKITPTPLNNQIKKLVPDLEGFGGSKDHNKTFGDRATVNDWRNLNRSTECTTYTSNSKKDMKKQLVTSYFRPSPYANIINRKTHQRNFPSRNVSPGNMKTEQINIFGSKQLVKPRP